MPGQSKSCQIKPIDQVNIALTEMRHYSNARFNRLAAFLLVIAALLTTYKDSALPIWIIPIVGLLITPIFWMVLRRAEDYYSSARFAYDELKMEYLSDSPLYNYPPKRRGFILTSQASLS